MILRKDSISRDLPVPSLTDDQHRRDLEFAVSYVWCVDMEISPLKADAIHKQDLFVCLKTMHLTPC